MRMALPDWGLCAGQLLLRSHQSLVGTVVDVECVQRGRRKMRIVS